MNLETIVITRELSDLSALARFYRRLEAEGRILKVTGDRGHLFRRARPEVSRAPDGAVVPVRAFLRYELRGQVMRVQIDGLRVRVECSLECLDSLEAMLDDGQSPRVRLARTRLTELQLADVYERLPRPLRIVEDGVIHLDEKGRFFPRRLTVETTQGYRLEFGPNELAVVAEASEREVAAAWLQDLLTGEKRPPAAPQARLHILIGETTDHVPKASRPGDRVLFLARGALVATGAVADHPTPDDERKGYYHAPIGGYRALESPVPLAEVKELLPDWKFLNYPRTCTTVPEPFASPLLSRLDETGGACSAGGESAHP